MSQHDTSRLRKAWIIWFIVVGICLVRGALQPMKSNCFPCYQQGGQNWAHGNDLYAAVADTCRYSPIVHAGFAPFSMLPNSVAATVWRLFESVLLLGALAYWMRVFVPFDDRERSRVLLLTIPLMMGNLNAGQSNAIMMAGLLCGIAALRQERFCLAAIAFAVACALKIYPLALVGLFVIVQPRHLGPRFLIAAIGLMLLPFLLKDPEYVARQYGRWVDNLVDDDRSNWPLVNGFRDTWMLLRMTGLPINFTAYRIFTLMAGVAMACLVFVHRGQGDRMLEQVFALGCCWMTVFGPATEGHTYILLVPSLSLLTVQAMRGDVPAWMNKWIYFAIGSFMIMIMIQATPLIHVPAFLVSMPLGTLATLRVLVPLMAQPAEQPELLRMEAQCAHS